MDVRRKFPWWAKMAAKIALARIPLKRHHWEKLGLFVHGQMDTPEYALRVMKAHLERVGWNDLRGKTVLELGPGDGLFTSLIATALGARRVYLVDVDPVASSGIEVYRSGCDYLRQVGLTPPDLSQCQTPDEMLRICCAEYLTHGLDSLREIATHSVDLIFSQAVLEHVRIGDFAATVQEMRRIVSPAGVTSHEVDLKDHLGYALNNLRFSTRIWESPFMSNSGFYTNRLRSHEIVDLFHRSGFRVRVGTVNRWERPPTPQRAYAAEFKHIKEEHLLVSEFDFLSYPT